MKILLSSAIISLAVFFHSQFSLFLCEDNTTGWYTSCGNFFNCGKINNLDYPFWGGNRPEGCGHPRLKLDCNGDTTSITIMSVRYRVLEINPKTQILRVTREDLSRDICPQGFINTTIDPTVFEFPSGYVNLTIQYGCPPPALNFPVPHQLTCNINGVSYQNSYVLPGVLGHGTCRTSIFVPIHSSNSGGIGAGLSNLVELIEGGFEVRWKVDSTACSDCKNSNGTCGYDFGLNRFTCLCPHNQSPAGSRTCTNLLVDTERRPEPSPLASGAHAFDYKCDYMFR